MRYFLVRQGHPLELNHEIADVSWDEMRSLHPGENVLVVYAETPEEALEVAEDYDPNKHQPDRIWCGVCGTSHRAISGSTVH